MPTTKVDTYKTETILGLKLKRMLFLREKLKIYTHPSCPPEKWFQTRLSPFNGEKQSRHERKKPY